MQRTKNNTATYWINARLIRPGDDHYTVDSDLGVVKTFGTHADAETWCEQCGESYFDNTV